MSQFSASAPRLTTNPSGQPQDASALTLNRRSYVYASNTAHTPIAITPTTGVGFTSGTPSGSQIAIPVNARFVWIQPIDGDAYICFAESATPPAKAFTGDETVPSGTGNWFELTPGTDRSFMLDLSAGSACAVVFGY